MGLNFWICLLTLNWKSSEGNWKAYSIQCPCFQHVCLNNICRTNGQEGEIFGSADIYIFRVGAWKNLHISCWITEYASGCGSNRFLKWTQCHSIPLIRPWSDEWTRKIYSTFGRHAMMITDTIGMSDGSEPHHIWVKSKPIKLYNWWSLCSSYLPGD